MANHLISVIMSVYNVNNIFLVESIESILSQTYKNIEFLIFDDCTNEENKKILKKYADKDNRIILFENSTNKGLTANLIYGIQQAKGKYICRQDADDISGNERIKKEYQYLEANIDVAMVATNMWIREGNRTIKRNKYIEHYKYIRTRLFFENCIMHSSVMIRADILHENNLNYCITFKKAQDYDLWVRLTDFGKIIVLNERLCTLRIHKNQITKKCGLEQKEYYLKTAISQLENIGLQLDDNNIELHTKLLTGNTSELRKTIKWSIKLLNVKKTSNMWGIYFNICVIERTLKLIIKKIINK